MNACKVYTSGEPTRTDTSPNTKLELFECLPTELSCIALVHFRERVEYFVQGTAGEGYDARNVQGLRSRVRLCRRRRAGRSANHVDCEDSNMVGGVGGMTWQVVMDVRGWDVSWR
jgi:hypothetical protein